MFIKGVAHLRLDFYSNPNGPTANKKNLLAQGIPVFGERVWCLEQDHCLLLCLGSLPESTSTNLTKFASLTKEQMFETWEKLNNSQDSLHLRPQHHGEWLKLLSSTSPEQNCHLWKTSTPSRAGKRLPGSPKTPATPSHKLFCLLASSRRYLSIQPCSIRLRDSFIPQAIRLLNPGAHRYVTLAAPHWHEGWASAILIQYLLVLYTCYTAYSTTPPAHMPVYSYVNYVVINHLKDEIFPSD